MTIHPVKVVGYGGGSHVPGTAERWVGSRPSPGKEHNLVVAALSNFVALSNEQYVKINEKDWSGLLFYVEIEHRRYAIASIVFSSLPYMKLDVLIDKYQTADRKHRKQAQLITKMLRDWTTAKQHTSLQKEKIVKPSWYEYSK